MNDNLVPVHGSSPLLDGVLIGYPSPSKEIEFILSLRGKAVDLEKTEELGKLVFNDPHTRQYVTHGELKDLSGAYPEDINAIESYFSTYNIHIRQRNQLTRTLTLSGTIESIEKAFHTEIATFEGVDRHAYLSNLTNHLLPSDLNEKINKIKIFAHPIKKEFRLPTKPIVDSKKSKEFHSPLSVAAGGQQGYSLKELMKAYNFPENLTGKGQVIGIVELGGKLNPADFDQYFAQMDVKAPEVREVGIPPVSDEQTSLLSNAEVTLDLEVIGAIAPESTLIVYYGNTIIDAMKEIIGDTTNNPSVVSISWAGSEFNYSPQDIEEMNGLFHQASLLGITVVAASADHGAYNGKTFPNVSLPASNPLVLACGGTIVAITNDRITSQVVWNELNGQVASGGGYSQLYALPSYQYPAVANYPYYQSAMRGVPDIAANAGMTNGYQVVFNGNNTVIGGTSAATPFVAALLALVNEKLGYRLGFINALLYSFAGSDAYSPITAGNNQVYPAAPVWNPCTGLGSPVGDKLLTFFEKMNTKP